LGLGGFAAYERKVGVSPAGSGTQGKGEGQIVEVIVLLVLMSMTARERIVTKR